MAIPEQVIQDIKYKNDIENAISPYVTLKRRGKNLVGLCPFHGEKTPSFTVYPESGSFYCFGCGVGGDVFTFTGLIEGLDYIESVKLLAERSGITLPEDGYDDSFAKLKNRIYDINRETAKFYYSFLMSEEGAWGREYLKNRGLTDETITHFGLGCAPDSWDSLINHLKAKGYSVKDMLAANVISEGRNNSYYDRFRKRVMFPIINIRGNVVGFSGRALPGDEKAGGKYVNTSDTPVYKKGENLFGMNFAKNNCAEQVIIVEGNMDAVSLHQAGVTNTVAAFGTGFTKEQVNLISRYTKEVVLMFDSDEAGQKAVRRASEQLKNSGLSVKVVVIPDGKDPDEFIKKQGPERFKALLKGAVSDIEYKLLVAAEGVDTDSDNGRLQYLSKAAEVIAESDDEMTRDIYIGSMCEKYGVSRIALTAKVAELRKKHYRAERKKETENIIMPRYNKDSVNPEKRGALKAAVAEENLIIVLLQHPDFYPLAKEKLTVENMVTSLNKRIYGIICETLDAGYNLDVSVFGERLIPSELGYLVSLQNSDRIMQNAKAVMNDCINVILEESENRNKTDVKEMSDDDWAKNLENIIEKRKKGNK